MKHACDLIFICIPFNVQLHTLHWYPRCIKSAFRATLSAVNILAVVRTNILAKIVYIVLTQLSMNVGISVHITYRLILNDPFVSR